jgi:periplasmic divalent cation tolerance protein
MSTEMSTETPYIVVLVAAGSIEEARSLARTAVERKLAACVQFFPIQSVFEWEGAIQEETEYLLLFKSRRDAYADLEASLREVHSYDVPEIIALPLSDGHEPYLQWLTGIVGSRTPQSSKS